MKSDSNIDYTFGDNPYCQIQVANQGNLFINYNRGIEFAIISIKL